MTIEKIMNDATVTLKLIGRLDTSTAPELEATIDGCPVHSSVSEP